MGSQRVAKAGLGESVPRVGEFDISMTFCSLDFSWTDTKQTLPQNRVFGLNVRREPRLLDQRTTSLVVKYCRGSWQLATFLSKFSPRLFLCGSSGVSPVQVLLGSRGGHGPQPQCGSAGHPLPWLNYPP